MSSAVGLLPLSLFYGYDIMKDFLQGLHEIDYNLYDDQSHSVHDDLRMLGLIGWYNTYICGHNSRAILPYC